MKKKSSSRSAKFDLIRRSSKDAYEAAKAAGRPIIEVMAGGRSDDGFHQFGGMLFQGDAGTPVTGQFPVAWADFLDSQKPKRGRPRSSMESNIAKFLSSLYFYFQTGGGIKKARVLAAQRIVPGTDPEAAEKRYRLAEKAVHKSRVLADFGRVLATDGWLTAAHKTAKVDVQADGVCLSGVFWRVRIGDAYAERVKLDYFLARVGSNGRKTGGTINPAE